MSEEKEVMKKGKQALQRLFHVFNSSLQALDAAGRKIKESHQKLAQAKDLPET